jgi:hypothetical protein
MRSISTFVLWVVVIAAGIAGPFMSMLLLFLVAELLWDAATAIGVPVALSLCIGVVAGLLLGKLHPRPSQPSAT